MVGYKLANTHTHKDALNEPQANRYGAVLSACPSHSDGCK